MGRSGLLFFAADFTSLFGNSAIGLVLPWLVLTTTGDAAAAGLVAALSALPGFVAAILGGSLIDRLGKRRVALIADIGSAVAVAALPIVDLTLGLNIGWFILLGVLGALFDVPGMTARDAMLPDVARDTGMSVDRVSGIREALFGASFLVGPALAGLGLAFLPAPTVLWLTCGCSALAALLTLGLPNRPGEPVGTSPRAWFEHVREGIGILARNPVALGTTVLAIGAVLAISPMQGVVLPAFFVKLNAPGLLGLTLCAVAVGLIGGSLLYAPLVRRTSRRAMLVLALLVSLAAFGTFAALPIVAVVIPAAVLIGFGFGTLNPMFPVLIAERVPESARGRVLGLQNAGYLAGYPIGVLLAGIIVQAGGVQLGVIVTALIWAGFVIFGLLAPGLRSLERPASAAPDRDDPPAA